MRRAVTLASTILGALLVAYVGMPHILTAQMRRDDFSLQDIYRAAVFATAFGASAGFGVGMALTASGDRRRRNAQTARYLNAQMRREDLPEDMRIAVAYLQQDIQDSRHK